MYFFSTFAFALVEFVYQQESLRLKITEHLILGQKVKEVERNSLKIFHIRRISRNDLLNDLHYQC